MRRKSMQNLRNQLRYRFSSSFHSFYLDWLLTPFQGSGKSGENVEELKKKLAAAEARARDFGQFVNSCSLHFSDERSILDILKKQSEAQAREYDRLADDYNKVTGSTSDKRKD